MPDVLTMVNLLRSHGWMVAIHNDYRDDATGTTRTYWMFTHEGLGAFKDADGANDQEAVTAIYQDYFGWEASGDREAAMGVGTMSEELSRSERDLLHWLSQEDFSQYGECHGVTLDALISKGLAQIHPNSGRNNTFIAKGDSIMYQAVSLTEAGMDCAKRGAGQ